jgi:transposase
MKSYGKKSRDYTLILALAGGATVPQAAKQAGVANSTAYRRLEDPEFARQVTAARDEMFSRAVGRLADAATAAVSKLVELLETGSPTVQLGAARTILEFGPKIRESSEMEARIAALEASNHAK